WGRAVAVIVPSAMFGAVHVLNGKLSLVSFIQLLIAGSIVGILFSLVTYESGSIWSAALMHSIWNMCMASGILNIGTEPMNTCIFNYVLESRSTLITGGEFGAEASVISVAAYLIFTVIAVILLRKKSREAAV
ncbi:MAG: CPBP family intramembrane metalloprotease, partial [Oscillospiraceae bacterium]|nr:CPBP family intramembrane metalloprotease [Oscillospiraceae bacterium]